MLEIDTLELDMLELGLLELILTALLGGAVVGETKGAVIPFSVGPQSEPVVRVGLKVLHQTGTRLPFVHLF